MCIFGLVMCVSVLGAGPVSQSVPPPPINHHDHDHTHAPAAPPRPSSRPAPPAPPVFSINLDSFRSLTIELSVYTSCKHKHMHACINQLSSRAPHQQEDQNNKQKRAPIIVIYLHGVDRLQLRLQLRLSKFRFSGLGIGGGVRTGCMLHMHTQSTPCAPQPHTTAPRSRPPAAAPCPPPPRLPRPHPPRLGGPSAQKQPNPASVWWNVGTCRNESVHRGLHPTEGKEKGQTHGNGTHAHTDLACLHQLR